MWILILGLTVGFVISVSVFSASILPSVALEIRQEKAHGLLAKAYAQKALKLGGVYALRTREKGKFGRYLGEIKVGRTTINKLLIKEKLAVAYTGQNKKDIAAAQEANRLAL